MRRIATSGGPITTIAQGLHLDIPPIAVDAMYVYWIEALGALRRAPLDGGPPETIPTSLKPGANNMIVDTTSVFVSGQDEVTSLPKSGGALTTLEWPEWSGDFRQIAMRGDDLYVAAFQHSLEHLTKEGGVSQSLVTDATMGTVAAADAQAAYYVAGPYPTYTIYRICRDGSVPPERLADIQGGYAVAVDDSGIYFDNAPSLGGLPSSTSLRAHPASQQAVD